MKIKFPKKNPWFPFWFAFNIFLIVFSNHIIITVILILAYILGSWLLLDWIDEFRRLNKLKPKKRKELLKAWEKFLQASKEAAASFFILSAFCFRVLIGVVVLNYMSVNLITSESSKHPNIIMGSLTVFCFCYIFFPVLRHLAWRVLNKKNG